MNRIGYTDHNGFALDRAAGLYMNTANEKARGWFRAERCWNCENPETFTAEQHRSTFKKTA